MYGRKRFSEGRITMIKKNIAKLINVKTIITITVIGVLSTLVLKNQGDADLTIAYVGIASSIITYYFNKSGKKEEEEK